VAGSIFEAAHFLEDKPLTGRGFLTNNLKYLADMFSVNVPEATVLITNEELYEIEVYRAVHCAAMILKTSNFSKIVKDKIANYGWPKEILTKMGIGSITNQADYFSRMTKQYGFTMEFLKAVDLDSHLFNENNLIYTVKDELGVPVGFAARDLLYETKKKAYEDAVAEDTANKKETSSLFKPVKFLNTAVKCPIYQKSKRLFNFNIAKKHHPPLYVFEGYSDCATAMAAGIKNSVAIGSVSFTKDHLDLVLGSGVKHVVFVLDSDKAGIEGTDRFVKLLEDNLGGHIGLRVEVIMMPEGSDDPDSYIRSFGLEHGGQEFRKLERISIFSWNIKRCLQKGTEAIHAAEENIPLIVNEQNYLIRMQMAEQLAQSTGLDKEGLWREVLRQVDNELLKVEEEKTQIAHRTSKELLRNSRDIGTILESAKTQIEIVEKRRTGYDPLNTIKAVEFVMDRAERVTKSMELTTGYTLLDRAINGLPREEAFISVPGKPNQGKSTFLDNLTWRVLDDNADSIVLFHTVDDSLSARISRLLASKYRVKSEYFKRAGWYLMKDNLPKDCDFEDIYQRAKKWLNDMLTSERLIVADVAGLPPSLPSLESWVRSIRQKFPKMAQIVIGDNLHLFDLPGQEPGEDKLREMSKFIKRMANQQRVTCLFTAELPKASLNPGRRPRIANIKGTSGIAYDANANLGIYNDMKDKGEKATLVWEDSNDMESLVGPNGERSKKSKIKPIVEVVIDKSKLSSFDGSLFFKLDPESGYMEECSDTEQQRYKELAVETFQ
jgi:replicative DNA helicase